jgi:hypothetical protein
MGENNSGYRNSGDRNSGNQNSGYWNSGDRNSGDRNSGNWNSGDQNSGNWNSGYRNSGYWNSGDRNSGYLNTTEPPVRIFNKDTDMSLEDIDFPDFFYFELNEWVSSNNMSEGDKKEHPFWGTTGGYLKSYDYKEAWKRSWDKADEEDRAKLFALPNFDADIFFEISGIDVRQSTQEVVELNGQKYLKSELEEALKHINPID